MTTAHAIAAGLPLVELELELEAEAAGQAVATRDEHYYDWRNTGGCTDPACDRHAREKQLAPQGDWRVWLLMSGRRWGKSLSGAQWIRQRVEQEGARYIAIVAQTKSDARDVMVEGPSGILAVSPPWNRPLYESSKRRLTWPNGAQATIYSADEPDQLRGPEHDTAWADEPAKWSYLDDPLNSPWGNMMIGLSRPTASGKRARSVATTTPRPLRFIRDLLKDDTAVITRGHTEENMANLDEAMRKEIIEKYEGTRLGRQELAGEVLEDVEGALWKLTQIDALRVKEAPDLDRIVVAIDPSGSDDEGASEQGIVSAGRGMCDCRGGLERHYFVLRDDSGHYTPNDWGEKAISAYRALSADRIVAESNFGGEMVENTIRTIDKRIAYKAVSASRGKQVRAEPIAAKYEQGKVHHVGAFPKLEDQQCSWVPGVKSPNDRLDALVWALTELDTAAHSGISIDDGNADRSMRPELAGVRRRDF